MTISPKACQNANSTEGEEEWEGGNARMGWHCSLGQGRSESGRCFLLSTAGWEAFGVAKVEEGRLLPGLYLLEQNWLSHFTVQG